jgi:hypothetical protein
MNYSIDRIIDVHEIWELENGELAVIVELAKGIIDNKTYVVFASKGITYVEEFDSFLSIKSSRSGLTHYYKNNKVAYP